MSDSIPSIEAQIQNLEREIAQKRKQIDALREALSNRKGHGADTPPQH